MNDAAQFQDACDRQDYAPLQESISHMSKRDAVDHLCNLFPHKARAWHTRNLPYLTALDPIQLHDVLDYNDPTPREAIRNLERKAP